MLTNKHKLICVCEHCTGFADTLPRNESEKLVKAKKQRNGMHLIEELINAVFVDMERSIACEEGTEIWTLPSDSNIYWNGSSTKSLVIQPQWLQLYAQLMSGAQTHVLLEGKSGRGKSAFLRYMIIRMLEDPAIPSEATIAYVVKDMSNSLVFWIEKNGISVVNMNKLPKRPDYLLLDDVDFALDFRGEKLNLELTSGNRTDMKEFRKRVGEARELGQNYAIQALDLKSMRLMFPDLPTADLQFRYDVVGGNPRMFLSCGPAVLSQEIQERVFPELQKCISMFFGTAYDYKLETAEGLRARWAMYMIAEEIKHGASSDSSLFWAEFATDSGGYETRFASTFLRLVAGALDSTNDATLREAVKMIVRK